MKQALRAARIFDGTGFVAGDTVLMDAGVIQGVEMSCSAVTTDLGGGILCPGFVDLQVNGGGGVLLGQGDPAQELATICAVHGRLGATALLPTLITSDRATFHAVLDAGIAAARAGVPGFAGLHLEGPFLDTGRAGAHDPALIRPMEDSDLQALLAAALALPALMLTVAPCAVTDAQISALARAGVRVSLGHSDATESVARRAFDAGACGVTHLYNAMSPLTHRAPGLVGAALDAPVWAGIIPDGVHVAASAFRIAVAAKPGRLFAVSDAMAVAGTDATGFTLNERQITRRNGRLTLADGTLAGADISLPQAVRWMVEEAGIEPRIALAMVSSRPAQVIGAAHLGHIRPGAVADLVHLGDDFSLQGVWRCGVRLV